MINLNLTRSEYYQKGKHVFKPTPRWSLTATYTITSKEEYRFWLGWISINILTYKDRVFEKGTVEPSYCVELLEDVWNQLTIDPFEGILTLRFENYKLQEITQVINESQHKNEDCTASINSLGLAYLNTFKNTLKSTFTHA